MNWRRDDGQASTALLGMFTFVVIMVAVLAIPRLATAGTERTGLDSSADAAALAGAQKVQDMLPEIIAAYAKSGGSGALVGDAGVDAAISFAERNGSHVISYRYTPENGLVTVSVVSSDVQTNGRHNEGRAVADTRFAFGIGCSLEEDPSEPAPNPAGPSPSPSPEPTPPPPVKGHLKCNGKSIDIEMDEHGKVTVKMAPGQIKKLLVGDLKASLVR